MSLSAHPEIQQQAGVTVVRLGPDFSSLYEGDLGTLAALPGLADTAEPALMVLDLSHTKYFGSAFIGFAITLANRLRARGGRFAISGLSSFGRMALQTTRSDLLLELFDSVDLAVAGLQSA